MDKTFDEAIAGIRTAERGVEVREDIAQGMEYVKQCAEEVTGQQQAALQAAQTATGAASIATEKAAAAEDSANRAAAIVSTDETLSIKGAPADGKATGDAVKGLISVDAAKTLIADALAEDHAKIKFWISVDSTSPAALFGGSWEEIASERVLMGASSTHAAGTTVKAGLPNITGQLPGIKTIGYNGSSDFPISGAFAWTNTQSTRYSYNDGDDLPLHIYQAAFDASKSNAIYGRSSTVQPAAYYVHIWHRVA